MGRPPQPPAWLSRQAEALFAFFERNIVNPLGGFHDLDDFGRPTPPGYGAGGSPARYLFSTTRIVHAFSIAHLMGRPGADVIVDHGMEFLWNGHRDAENGGYYWGVGYEGPSDSVKQAYGHAFVLLAASSAKVAGHPDAGRLLADVSTVIKDRFWEETFGAVAEEFTSDWREFNSYRGQNSNMHLTEALMAAFEATDDSTYLRMAEQVAERIVHANAATTIGVCRSISRRTGRSTGTIPAVRCSVHTAPRRGTPWNGRGCCSNSGNSAGESSTG